MTSGSSIELMSSASEKKAVTQFKSVTGSTDAVAKDILKKNGWDVEQAIDSFYASRLDKEKEKEKEAPPKKVDTSKLEKLFSKYAGSGDDKDSMIEEKLAEFFRDMGVDPEGATTLGVAWKLKCKTLGEIGRKEFVEGFSAMGADNDAKIKTEMGKINKLLDDQYMFKEFYRWLFDFIKEEPERKTVDTPIALTMWGIVLPRHFKLIDQWKKFIQKQELKQVSRDLWDMLFEFGKDIKADLSNWEDNGAWPVIVDEFVEFVKNNPSK